MQYVDSVKLPSAVAANTLSSEFRFSWGKSGKFKVKAFTVIYKTGKENCSLIMVHGDSDVVVNDVSLSAIGAEASKIQSRIERPLEVELVQSAYFKCQLRTPPGVTLAIDDVSITFYGEKVK